MLSPEAGEGEELEEEPFLGDNESDDDADLDDDLEELDGGGELEEEDLLPGETDLSLVPSPVFAGIVADGSGAGPAVETAADLLPPVFECPFGTAFPPVIRFSYEGDSCMVAKLPPAVVKRLRWRFTKTTGSVVKNMLRRVGFRPTAKSGWVGQWGGHMKDAVFKKLLPSQKVNHLPGSFCIGRKDSLWKHISRMATLHSKDDWDFLPECFIMPRDKKRLKRAYDEAEANSKWILKPCASARGIGIRVVEKWADIPKTKRLLVQRYVRQPFLINETKFDMRIYVHVTSYDPLRIYICRDGLVRFATQKYSNKRSSTKNRYMHLTNYSINKNSDDFVSNDDVDACQGHKWSLKTLMAFWREEGKVDTDMVWNSICDVVVKTMLAADGKINSHAKTFLKQRSSGHELFGFDIMLDRDLKAWLLEVNISPSLHAASALDRDIKGRMMRDVFNLAGFRVPPPAPTDDPEATAGEDEPPQAHENAADAPAAKAGRSRSRMDVGNGRLTAEERAKHAFYTSRYTEGGGSGCSSILNGLTDDDIEVLMESEAEFLRRGEMERIFPSRKSGEMLKYTATPRYYNILLEQWNRQFRDDHAGAIAALQRMIYLGPKRHRPNPTDEVTVRDIAHYRRFTTSNQHFLSYPVGGSGGRLGPSAPAKEKDGSSARSSAPAKLTRTSSKDTSPRRIRRCTSAAFAAAIRTEARRVGGAPSGGAAPSPPRRAHSLPHPPPQTQAQLHASRVSAPVTQHRFSMLGPMSGQGTAGSSSGVAPFVTSGVRAAAADAVPNSGAGDRPFADIVTEAATSRRAVASKEMQAQDMIQHPETSRVLDEASRKLGAVSLHDRPVGPGGLSQTRLTRAPTVHDIETASLADVTSNASSGPPTPIALRKSGPPGAADFFSDELPAFVITPVSNRHTASQRRRSGSAGVTRTQQPVYEYAAWQETHGLPSRGVYTSRPQPEAILVGRGVSRTRPQGSGQSHTAVLALTTRRSTKKKTPAFGAATARFPTIPTAKTRL